MRVALPLIRAAAKDMISRHSSTVSELNSPVFPQGVITLTPAASRESKFFPSALKSIERSEPNGVILIPTMVFKRAARSFGCFKGFDGWGIAFSMLDEAQRIGSRLSSSISRGEATSSMRNRHPASLTFGNENFTTEMRSSIFTILASKKDLTLSLGRFMFKSNHYYKRSML